MKILLDTSVIIDHLRGLDRATQLLREAATRGDELWSVAVVRTEVLAGMRPREEEATTELFKLLKWVDVDIELADSAGDQARSYMKSHQGVDTIDYLIAAAAQALDADLATTNVKHFPMFADLEAAY